MSGWWWPDTTIALDEVQRLRRARAGMIECREGAFGRFAERWMPRHVSQFGVWCAGLPFWPRSERASDRCRLYIHDPGGRSAFLAVTYLVTTPGTRLATVIRALETLDYIAFQKRVAAIVCEVSNRRMTDRALRRWGFEPHCLDAGGRHFIKRFYGEYPRLAGWLPQST